MNLIEIIETILMLVGITAIGIDLTIKLVRGLKGA